MLQKEIPLKKIKTEKILLKASAWAVVAGENLLLARRPPGKWLAGMWDLPWSVVDEASAHKSAPFGREVAACSQARTITKHKVEFEVRGIVCDREPAARELLCLCADADEFRWVPLGDLHGINLPRPSEKALAKILPKLN